MELNEPKIKYNVKTDKTMRQFKGHTGHCMVSKVFPNNKQESCAIAKMTA